MRLGGRHAASQVKSTARVEIAGICYNLINQVQRVIGVQYGLDEHAVRVRQNHHATARRPFHRGHGVANPVAEFHPLQTRNDLSLTLRGRQSVYLLLLPDELHVPVHHVGPLRA